MTKYKSLNDIRGIILLIIIVKLNGNLIHMICVFTKIYKRIKWHTSNKLF